MSQVPLIIRNICDKLKENPRIDITRLDLPTYDTENVIQKEIENTPKNFHHRIRSEFFGDGPLETLFSDEDINEIVINGFDEIWLEKNGHFEKSSDAFASTLTYHQFIHRICKKLNTQLTFEEPFLCETFNNMRFHIVSPQITLSDYCVCIRKHTSTPWTLQKLLELQSLTPAQLDCIQTILVQKKNFLVVGSTGSGKTSFLNACLNTFPETERVVILEDTNELNLPNRVSTKLLTKNDIYEGTLKIDLSRLLKESLRMRPDRLVLGEVRGAEAKDLLMALATGHQGSFGTIHANSANEALLRLEMLIQLGAPNWGLEAIRKLIFLSLNYIICIQKNEKSQRVISGIHQISGLESFGCLIEKIC